MNLHKTSVGKVRKIIIEMFRGYPHYVYWGLFEEAFKNRAEVEAVIMLLSEDGLIDFSANMHNEKEIAYRLTPKGIDFAISMIQLDYSQKVYRFTIAVLVFAILTFITSIIPLIYL